MSSPYKLKEANKLVIDEEIILQAFTEENNLRILLYLLQEGTKDIRSLSNALDIAVNDVKEILEKLSRVDLIISKEGDYSLTQRTIDRLTYSEMSLDFLVGQSIPGNIQNVQHALSQNYEIKKIIGKGATSYTFLAVQTNIHRERTLKVFFPDLVTFDELDRALQARSQIKRGMALPELIDAGQINISFPSGNKKTVSCIVLEYIDGGAKTFSEFLKAHNNLDATIYERFIERIGGTLAAIEEAGLVHGDLHEGNILVTPGVSSSVAREFYLIDFVGVPSFVSKKLEIQSDLDNFRDHLLRAAIIGCQRYPGYAARYLLGERAFRILNKLRNEEYTSFKQLLEDYNQTPIDVPGNYFQSPSPQPFEWLRVEWITSQDWLYKLFEPIRSRFDIISRFGNTWISGPRGCGKSHYLRVMAFNPEVIVNARSDKALEKKLVQINYNFKKAFGVLFTCRLGEFKGFVPEVTGKNTFDVNIQEILKHILVLKIWNKTLNTIREGLECYDPVSKSTLLGIPGNFNKLIKLLEKTLGNMAIVDNASPLSIFYQCQAVCTAQENSSIAVWYHPEIKPFPHLLNESDLNEFFVILRDTFVELRDSQFYILVDDASYGHMHFEMQKILNSLIRAAQKNHCFKVTCDKYMYTLEASDGRSIDPNNEVTYVDLGEVSTKSQRERVIDLSQHLSRVIDLRLKAAGYKLGIRQILGKSQSVKEFLSAICLPRARRPLKNGKITNSLNRPHAYYAGWNIIWNLSHGSIRSLLQLIEYIFKNNEYNEKNSNTISLQAQDKAVRSYASNQFKALTMLPGELDGEPIGQRLQSVVSAIGEMSRQYIEHYDTGEEDRWYETISVERLDRKKLDPEAQTILNELIKHGLVLDEGTTFSRADFGLCHRYDLNKIFTPAFQITYRVRNHIYLSKLPFEQLLLKPDAFANRYRKKLSELAKRKTSIQQSLFEDSEND
jgi:tRNA A-37 threonylcarbamoyl transferase component Bud32